MMSSCRLRLGSLVALLAPLLTCSVSALPMITALSLDPASTSLTSGRTPADVVTPGQGLPGLRSGTQLGLQNNFPGGSYDNLNSLSFNETELVDDFLFSVDRLAQGTTGTAVAQQFAAQRVGASVFVAQSGKLTNSLAYSPAQLGLAGGFVGDDLDALVAEDSAHVQFYYFTIDGLSPSAMLLAGNRASDILVNSAIGTFGVFAEGVPTIGLQNGDEIDALILIDNGQIGVLDVGVDVALFSLSPFSPTSYTRSGASYAAGVAGQLSPADILVTDFSGSFALFTGANQIGLRPSDNVDALAVPEPGDWFAMLCIAMAIVLSGRTFAAARSVNQGDQP